MYMTEKIFTKGFGHSTYCFSFNIKTERPSKYVDPLGSREGARQAEGLLWLWPPLREASTQVDSGSSLQWQALRDLAPGIDPRTVNRISSACLQSPSLQDSYNELEQLAITTEISKAGPLLQVLFGWSSFPLSYHLSTVTDGRIWRLHFLLTLTSCRVDLKGKEDSCMTPITIQFYLKNCIWGSSNIFQNNDERNVWQSDRFLYFHPKCFRSSQFFP